jgi:chemotaxis protein CheX
MLVEISSAELTTIVDDIFGAMAGMQLVPCQTVVGFGAGAQYVASAVQIVGDWQGAVRLDIGLELGRRACANLTGVEPGELSPQDVRDAAGELANMVGGSVKTLCAHNSRLSLPTVAMGSDFEFTLCQGTVIQALSFSHPAGMMTVSVIERQERGRP